MANSSVFKDILAEALGETPGKVHAYRHKLFSTGVIDKRGHGPYSRTWTTTDVTNLLIALTSGASLSTLDLDVTEIRELPRVPGWCHAENLEIFNEFTFHRAQTPGEFLEYIIDDHRQGLFQKWREPGAASLLCGVTFQDGGRTVQALVNDAGHRAMVSLAFGKPNAFRTYRVKHELRGDIDASRSDSDPTIFERLAEALGP